MLMVQAGNRGKLAGLVHGRSATGKSLYFEPLEVVEENNTLQGAVDELEGERQRLLHELLRDLAAESPLVRQMAGLIGELDALEAAHRLAREIDAHLPVLAPPGRMRLVGARHPLLDPRLARRRERVLGARGHESVVEPLDVELTPERRALVITGPNAGGKTVALKTLGLLALAAQAGLPIPAAATSEMPHLTSLVATVGDEQDLLADRSTFSGRLARLAEAYRAAGPQSLALLDELGSGTDPEEGTALAVALLETLVERGGLALITTHLTGLAAAALELPGATCAAMEFEPSTGRPTFRLLPGSPGGSEALALAGPMDLPAEWIARAEALLGDEHRDLRRLLAELEATRERLAVAAEATRVERAGAELAAERLERERAALEAERRTLGARVKRELAEFRERVTRELSATADRIRAQLAAGRKKSVAQQAAARLFAEAPQVDFGEEAAPDLPLVVGAQVRHGTLGWRGIVERLRRQGRGAGERQAPAPPDRRPHRRSGGRAAGEASRLPRRRKRRRRSGAGRAGAPISSASASSPRWRRWTPSSTRRCSPGAAKSASSTATARAPARRPCANGCASTRRWSPPAPGPPTKAATGDRRDAPRLADYNSPQMPPEPGPGGPEITALLVAVENGDRGAFDRLFEAVYTELRTIARRQLRGASSADTLSTTALVHEAYLKFSKQASWSVENRRHFYALAARAMRSVVIDHARRRGRVKRGGARVAVELDEQQIASPERAADLLAVDEALSRLESADPDLAQLVEWRFFGGLFDR